jgi:hypothetical protein
MRYKSCVPIVIAVSVCLVSILGVQAAAKGLKLDVPEIKSPADSKNLKVIIRSITDKRVFEDRPKTPDIPSYGIGLAKATREMQHLVVGRARDGYGKARRNVFLKKGQTVESLTENLIANAFKGAGYTILNKKQTADRDTLIIDVAIDKFWGWIRVNPGGALMGSGAMYMDGKILTTLRVTRNGKKAGHWMISGEGSHRLGIGVTTRNWLKLFRLMFEDYTANALKICKTLVD